MAKTPPSDTQPAAVKRGRPATENPHQRLARLEKELSDARAAVREAEQRRYVILGEAVAMEAASNPELKKTLADIIAKHVKSAAARAEVAPLLPP